MSRFTATRARRAFTPTVHRRRERQPTGGGRFFRARPRPADAPDLERLRDIFAHALKGTPLGKRLGYDDEPPRAA